MRRLLLHAPLPAVAAAVLAVVWIGPVEAVRAEPIRSVIAVHEGPETFPSNPILDKAIRSVLTVRTGIPVEYFAEYLESDRFPPDVAESALADYIRWKYRGRRIDVVIALTNPAFQFVLRHRELFSDAPIVFAGVSVPNRVILTAGGGVTGVKVSNAYADTLKLALELHPSTERVFVVANSPHWQNDDAVRRSLHDFSRSVTVEYLAADTVPALVAAVKQVPPRSLILFIWHAQQEPGHYVYSDEIARLVADAAPVPVYGTSDFYLGTGVIGGVMRRTAETGARVGRLAHRILEGARPQDLPVESARVVPTFDWRQLQRWRIDASGLPQGSVVLFRTPTAWESYRPYILGAAFVFVTQLALIAALLTQRTRRRNAELTIRKREATLLASYERTRNLAAQLINAQEGTRASIARELHDGVCQSLVGISMTLQKATGSTGKVQDADTQRLLSTIQDDMLDVHEEIRRVSHELHPASLELAGLAAALKAHCAEVAKRHAVRVTFKTSGDIGPLDPDVAVSLFRIAQESLRNGLEHGEASSLNVALARDGEHIELKVTDNGRGFDFDAVRGKNSGLGLVSIEERARLFGGEAKIMTQPGRGTAIRVRVPARSTGSVLTSGS
jgi:signal transduction histidine kinase